ncbi:hypothetical protein SNR37_000626 [Agarivorans aestuarii]|uniref:Uncharacterized protein n=1 Tax=Agarivorans aestuarii TaxID=1563703 RepID=A0ABU7G7L6_9ALTE|nr:DUF6776 family protein [Agarivorans aestuarii]MEE1675301.1 hypothetical protein [Agarivorans aestuarii]
MAKPKLLVVSLIGALALTSVYGLSVVVEEKDQLISQLKQQLSSSLDSQSVLQQRLSMVRLEQDTSLAELAQLKQNINQLTEQKHALSEELLVYRKIMAPEKQAGGMKIEQFHIEAMLSPNYYRMQVLLMQVARNKRWLSGELQLVVVGSQDQEPAQYSLAELQNQAVPLAFKFRYFQEVNTDIKLPEGFKAERIELTAKVKGNKWNKKAEIVYKQSWPKE